MVLDGCQENVSLEEAALLEPLNVALAAVRYFKPLTNSDNRHKLTVP